METLGSAKGSQVNFHTKRLSEHKVANLMQETFRKVSVDELVDSGPTKYATFRNKSKSIVTSGLPPPSFDRSKALLHSTIDPGELDASPQPS